MASEAQRAIEAIVMVADEPVEPQMLAQLLEVSVSGVEQLCSELAQAYEAEDRGFQLVRVAGGYRFQSHPDLAPYVERYVLEGQSARLSAAALETLAIVAYKQPVSRAQVGAIRGVNADAVIRTLQTRGYISEVGRDPGPGQALLYGTTTLFLEKLGFDNLGDLPPLAEFVPGPETMDALESSLRADHPTSSGQSYGSGQSNGSEQSRPSGLADDGDVEPGGYDEDDDEGAPGEAF